MPATYQGNASSNTSAAGWVTAHVYNQGDVVRPSPGTGQVFLAIAGGTSGGSQPAWSGPAFPTIGTQFTDNTVTWMCLASEPGPWAPVIQLPVDSDPPLAFGQVVPNSTLADQMSWLTSNAGLLPLNNTWTGLNTFWNADGAGGGVSIYAFAQIGSNTEAIVATGDGTGYAISASAAASGGGGVIGSSMGSGIGLWGFNSSGGGGSGVLGQNEGSFSGGAGHGAGVHGYADGTGAGVYGENTSGTGAGGDFLGNSVAAAVRGNGGGGGGGSFLAHFNGEFGVSGFGASGGTGIGVNGQGGGSGGAGGLFAANGGNSDGIDSTGFGGGAGVNGTGGGSGPGGYFQGNGAAGVIGQGGSGGSGGNGGYFVSNSGGWAGVVGFGNNTGAGGTFNGGDHGNGAEGVGGSSVGAGGFFSASATGAAGVEGAGNGTNGIGVIGDGNGGGGGVFQDGGGGPGLFAHSNGTRGGVALVPQAGAPSADNQGDLYCDNTVTPGTVSADVGASGVTGAPFTPNFSPLAATIAQGTGSLSNIDTAILNIQTLSVGFYEYKVWVAGAGNVGPGGGLNVALNGTTDYPGTITLQSSSGNSAEDWNDPGNNFAAISIPFYNGTPGQQFTMLLSVSGGSATAWAVLVKYT